ADSAIRLGGTVHLAGCQRLSGCDRKRRVLTPSAPHTLPKTSVQCRQAPRTAAGEAPPSTTRRRHAAYRRSACDSLRDSGGAERLLLAKDVPGEGGEDWRLAAAHAVTALVESHQMLDESVPAHA